MMSEDEARKTLLKLHLCHHDSKAQIKELVDAGVGIRRILYLYPFDFAEYTDYLDRWLANVPGAALKNLSLSLPPNVLLWKPKGLLKSWLDYYDGQDGARHLDIAQTFFPVNRSEFSYGVFFKDLHDALWYLANWSAAVEQCIDQLDVRTLTTYVRTWTNVLQDQRTYAATLKLDLTAAAR